MARTPRSGGNTGRPRPPVAARPGAKAAASATTVSREADAPKRRTNPVQFAREVRTEGRKITWTTWKETWITSVMVLILVTIATIFLFLTDTVLSFGIQNLFRLPEILS